MTQIERIRHMERILDEAAEAAKALQPALERYLELKPRIAELEAYYASAQWLKDYEDDEAGRLPEGLKRGVLSQDAVYDLLQLQRELRDMMKAE
ncbi:MAG: DUF4298 domain-containing protein [Clostridia bacterium]|nr:DUF4298 domain-containing protein [Clostridia bacterium]